MDEQNQTTNPDAEVETKQPQMNNVSYLFEEAKNGYTVEIRYDDENDDWHGDTYVFDTCQAALAFLTEQVTVSFG